MKLRAGFVFVLALAACQPPSRDLTDAERAAIADSVKAAHAGLFALVPSRNADSIMHTYFAPPARLTWAENAMVYPDGDSLMRTVRANLAGARSIQLTSGEPKISVMNRTLAVLTATFSEVVTDTAGHAMTIRGAWTAVYNRTPEGWKISTVHESSRPEPANSASAAPRPRRS